MVAVSCYWYANQHTFEISDDVGHQVWLRIWIFCFDRN